MRVDPIDVDSWWANVRPSPDVADRLAQTALVRAQVFLPVIIFALSFALIVSGPVGIPVPWPIVVLNLTVIAIAAAMYVALRRGKIMKAQGNAVCSLVWLMAPLTTLASVWMTDAGTLTLPLMIELASLAILIETRWALATSVPVVIAAFPLMARAGAGGIFPVAVLGVWAVGMMMQVSLRRSLIRAETHRLNMTSALAALQHELAERQRAEADREALRDQFVHAQRMDAVGTLSAGLAHDMNNILGGILAFAEILRAEATDPRIREDLDRIRQEAERGAALTRGLLAFSRRGAYRKRPIALGAVLDDIAPLISRTLGKNITLTRTDGPLAIIDGDPAQLGQVLINLCLNGADAMNGDGTLTIETATIELGANDVPNAPAGTYARLSVRDTGVGMDEATKKRMFEPFFTTKPVGKGTGLGLAMVYGAVEAHGGVIDVVTAPGAGTAVHVYLPITDAAIETTRRADSEPSRMQGTVLIVDDEPTIKHGVARMFERLGLTTASASDGEEALVVFRERQREIALVVLDMVMPKMSGAECFHELRKLAPVPILLMSGYTDHAATRELLAAGAAGFLEKPYSAEQLGVEVDRILGRRPSEASEPAKR